MQQNISPRASTAQVATASQLFLSHIIASGVAIAIFCWLTQSGLSPLQLVTVALVGGGIVGLLLISNILYNLHLLGLLLDRFAEQEQLIELTDTFWRWPLTSLFMQLHSLSERLKIYHEQAQMTAEFREQTLRQASEAAALEERNRIARDLHDSIKQQIFSISVSAAAAKAHMNGDGKDAREAVADIQQSVKEAQVEMQALLQQLRSSPLENTNLREALETQAQALGYRTGAQTHVNIATMPGADQLPPGAQEAIFRLVQEAFANIARHARAETVWLTFTQQTKQLQVEIRDDGQGFDPQTVQRGMGLNNLRERAHSIHGTLTIESSPGKGTSISTIIPLLDALSSKEERERQQLELRRMVEQAGLGIQLASSAITISGVLALINAPYYITLIAVGTIFYGYIQYFYTKARVALLAGKESIENRSLERREHGVRMLLLSFLLFTVFYLYIRFTLERYFAAAPWFLLIFTLLLCGILIFELTQRYRLTDRYYSVLQQPQLDWELEQESKRRVRSIRIWLLILAFNIILQHPLLGNPLHTVSTLMSDSIFAVIVIGCIIPCLDYLRVVRWKQRTAMMQNKP
jgi:signal transduction histidine kinase